MNVYNSKLAKLVGFINGCRGNYAVTTSATCTRYSCDKTVVFGNPQWMAHEDCHKVQIAREGWLFYPRYLWQLICNGYQDNKYEQEARR